MPFRESVLALPEMQGPDDEWMRETARGWNDNVVFLPAQGIFGAVMSDRDEGLVRNKAIHVALGSSARRSRSAQRPPTTPPVASPLRPGMFWH